MNTIAFIDTEIERKSRKILDIGGFKDNGYSFHSNSITDFIAFLRGTEFICGHNIFNHDLKYIQKAVSDAEINSANIIDTLFLSSLLFPSKPYHALGKDYKSQYEESNSPLNDSIITKDLFYEEVSAFKELDNEVKQILYLLLDDKLNITDNFFG